MSVSCRNFFFSCAHNTGLMYLYCPGKHTIFGRVCRGMEIIKRLGSVQTDNNDRYVFLRNIPDL